MALETKDHAARRVRLPDVHRGAQDDGDARAPQASGRDFGHGEVLEAQGPPVGVPQRALDPQLARLGQAVMPARDEPAQAAHGQEIAAAAFGAGVGLELERGVAIAEHDGNEVAPVQAAAPARREVQRHVLADRFDARQRDVPDARGLGRRQQAVKTRLRHAAQGVRDADGTPDVIRERAPELELANGIVCHRPIW